MKIASTEEIARVLYAQAVPIPQWNKEQDSYKFRFFEAAERLVADLNNGGLRIMTIEESDKTEPVEPISSYEADLPALDTPPVDKTQPVEKPKRSRRKGIS